MTEAPAQAPSEAISKRAVPEMAAAIIGAIAAYEPLRLHVVYVRDWFGSNWLGFKGKVLGALGVSSGPDRPLVIPPFVPNRVERAFWFERDSVDAPWATATRTPLNVQISSESNTRRYLERVAGPTTMAAWIGDNGQGRQSVMVYAYVGGVPVAWYASTETVGQHAGSKLAGISAAEFVMLQQKAAS